LTPAASEFLVERGYDEHFGARPLKRAIQKYVEDPLSEKILVGEFARGEEIEVDAAPDKERLAFARSPARRRDPQAFRRHLCGFGRARPAPRARQGEAPSAASAAVAPDSIVVIGLRRVDRKQVLDQSGLTPGRPLGYRDVQRAIQTLYATGQFDDVRVAQDTAGGRQLLVVRVHERPILVEVGGTRREPPLRGQRARQGQLDRRPTD